MKIEPTLDVGEAPDSFRLTKGGISFLGKKRIRLLQKIGQLGSITKAAKAADMSYKTAWDAVQIMNRVSEEPLVIATTGGKEGGGTELTEKGRKLIEIFNTLEKEHAQFLKTLNNRIHRFDEFYQLIRRISMKVSARNQFLGVISKIRSGAVSTEVHVRINDSTTIVAMITDGSADELELRVGQEAYALIKANLVILTSPGENFKTSARNRLCGTIVRILKGQVNSEVDIEFAPGSTVTAMITRESARQMGLKLGERACAIFKASSVILGVRG